jgi:hypothetical protein
VHAAHSANRLNNNKKCENNQTQKAKMMLAGRGVSNEMTPKPFI